MSTQTRAGSASRVEEYRAELAKSAAWMVERAGSMREYLAQQDRRERKKKGKKRRQRSSPTLTLKSYVLQEAEAVGREAKLRTATAMGLRVVSLQHDGVAICGIDLDATDRVEAAMSEAVTLSCGYRMTVVLERVRHVDIVD